MNYAGFWPRVGAALIDGFLLGIITLVMSMAMKIELIPNFQNLRAFTSPEAMAARSVLNQISFLIGAVYQVGMNTVYGATLGKMALGMKIVKADGGQAKFGSILARFILEQIIATVTCGLMYLSVVFNAESRGWHDQIAGTSVIHTR